MGKKTPKIAPFTWDFVTLPKEDQATVIGYCTTATSVRFDIDHSV